MRQVTNRPRLREALCGAGVFARHADVPGETDELHAADDKPTGVELPPREAVAGRSGNSG